MGAYEDFVKSIPAAERVPEPFTGIDNRLDFLGPKIIDMKNRVEKLEDTLATLQLPGGVMPEIKIEQIPYSYNLAIGGFAGSQVTLSEHAPFSGYIKEVSIHWPANCNALVDVRVGHGVKQFCPDEGFLALNNATPTYRFNEWVSDHEEIWVELRNRDGGFTHNISVTVSLEGVI